MKICIQLALLILLASSTSFGQQNQQTNLESPLTAAKQAQASGDYAAAAAAYRQCVSIRPEIAELWANLGLMEQEIGNYPEAILSFQQAHRLKPSLYVPVLFLGMDYSRTGRAKEAIPLLLAAEKMNSTDSQPYLALGRAYTSLQEYGPAAEAFAHVTRSNPAQSQAWFSLGIVYLHQVEADARTMSAKGQDSPFTKALFASSLASQSRYLEAVEMYKSVPSPREQPPCLHGELGFVYLKQHDASSAAKEFAIGSEPVCSLALLGQARLYVDSGSNEEALKILMQLWERDPGFLQSNASTFSEGMSGDRSSTFASLLTQQHDSSEVPDRLYEALTSALQGNAPQVNSSVPLTHTSAAASLVAAEKDYASGRYRECSDRTAVSIATRNQAELRLLAACSFLTGDEETSSRASAVLLAAAPQSMEALYWSIKSNERLAFHALERFEQLEPNSERTHLLLGDIYVQRERYGDARSEYQKALDLSPGDPAALLGLASAALHDGDTDKAIEAGQSALQRSPDDPEINILMGEALVVRHDLANAEPFLKKGLQSKPQMLPHVHALLGRVYAAAGRPQEAISELKMGLESDEDGSVHYQLARLYRQAGDDKDASLAMEQMKAIQQRRREGAAIALKDSHPSTLDDEP